MTSKTQPYTRLLLFFVLFIFDLTFLLVGNILFMSIISGIFMLFATFDKQLVLEKITIPSPQVPLYVCAKWRDNLLYLY